MTSWRVKSPVAVGGLGGSGTRVVAKILADMGLYLGADLNPQMDNLWFTLLFKTRRGMRELQLLHTDTITDRYAAFAAAMQGQRPPLAAWPGLLAATLDIALHGHNHLGDGRGRWAFQRLRSMLRAPTPMPNRFVGWGWKEPNTHVYLPIFSRCDPALRYIHVIRHGLDIAFSSNVQQLMRWGLLYDLEMAPPCEPTPAQKLKFWINANRRALNMGASMGTDRFLVVRFDDLCAHPKETIYRMAEFLGLSVDGVLTQCVEEVRTPHSLGRIRQEDLSQFDPQDLQMVEQFGFKL